MYKKLTITTIILLIMCITVSFAWMMDIVGHSGNEIAFRFEDSLYVSPNSLEVDISMEKNNVFKPLYSSANVDYEGEYFVEGSYLLTDTEIYKARNDTTLLPQDDSILIDNWELMVVTTYNTTTNYKPGDLVTYGDVIYECLVALKNVKPGTNATKWATIEYYDLNKKNVFASFDNQAPGDTLKFSINIKNTSNLDVNVSIMFSEILASHQDFYEFMEIGVISAKGFNNYIETPTIEEFAIKDRITDYENFVFDPEKSISINFLNNLKIPVGEEGVNIKFYIRLSTKAENTLQNQTFKIGKINFISA